VRDIPTTAYAILGLLAIGPMSRYDVAAYAQSSIAHFWNIERSQVYAELPRLEKQGLVEGSVVRQRALPTKRVYRLTAKGRARLVEWLEDPAFEPDRFRSEFLVKFFFGEQMSAEAALRLIRGYRAGAEAYVAELDRISAAVRKAGESEFARGTAVYGRELYEAAVKWTAGAERLVHRTAKRSERPAS
jgi:PadR family transcriptional regulator AphA